MERREAYLLLSVLTLAMALAFVFVPRTEGQRERNTCRRDCVRQYRECRGADDSDEAECRKALDECREECAGTRAKSNAKSDANKDAQAGQADSAEDAANSNANGNAGANTNGNANANVVKSPGFGGSEGPVRPPENRNSNRPPA